jgi:hypothetical protein
MSPTTKKGLEEGQKIFHASFKSVKRYVRLVDWIGISFYPA